MLYEQYGSLYKIKNNTSRSIFEDVVKAYHAGAYRSAIGSLWTLLVFDITIKINNNSIAGDKKSKEKLDKFEAAVKKLKNNNQYHDLLNWENSIISYAYETCGIIDETEKDELETIRKVRNRSVHPNWFFDEYSGELYVHKPNADTVDYMISVVYRSILTKDSYSIKFMIDKLTEDIKNGVIWRSDSEKIIDHFREKYFTKISSNKAIGDIFKVIIKAWMDPEGLAAYIDKNDEDSGSGVHIISRRARFIVRAFLNSEYHNTIVDTIYSSTERLLSSYVGKDYESDLCSLRLRSLLADKGNSDLEEIMSKLSVDRYTYQELQERHNNKFIFQERHNDKFIYGLESWYDTVLIDSGVFHTKVFESPVLFEYFKNKEHNEEFISGRILDLFLDDVDDWIEPNAYSNEYFKYLAEVGISSYDSGNIVCRAIKYLAPYIEDEESLREFISNFISDSQYHESRNSVRNMQDIFDRIPQRFKVYNIWEKFLNSDLLSGKALRSYGYVSCEEYMKLKSYIEDRLLN